MGLLSRLSRTRGLRLPGRLSPRRLGLLGRLAGLSLVPQRGTNPGLPPLLTNLATPSARCARIC